MAGNVVVVVGSLGGGDLDADRISGLPDDLLHSILLRLPGATAEAARTSVLSRRWRRVWAGLPELSLRYANDPRAPERVDAALAACSAPSVRRLDIAMPYFLPPHATAARVPSWLRFASRRVAGELRLTLPPPLHHNGGRRPQQQQEEEEEELTLPLCERLTAATLNIRRTLRLSSPAAGGGKFAALASLRIVFARVDGGELARVVSSRCPRLEELVLEAVSLEDGDHAHAVVSIRSGSLRRLVTALLPGFAGRLDIVAPELRTFYPRTLCDFDLVSPKLSRLRWPNADYDPCCHRLVEVGCHLQHLATVANSPAAALMRRFDAVDELSLTALVGKGVEEYKGYLEDIDRLTKCRVLSIRFLQLKHALKPTILHLLGKCNGIRKLVVQLSGTENNFRCNVMGCPCGVAEPIANTISLDSLEEIEVVDDGEECHRAELVRLLCKSSAMFQKRVTIIIQERRKGGYTQENIHRYFPRSNNVEIIIRPV
ncbi:hypothetical protein ACP4OV_007283 [Aristida adscensionis]